MSWFMLHFEEYYLCFTTFQSIIVNFSPFLQGSHCLDLTEMILWIDVVSGGWFGRVWLQHVNDSDGASLKCAPDDCVPDGSGVHRTVLSLCGHVTVTGPLNPGHHTAAALLEKNRHMSTLKSSKTCLCYFSIPLPASGVLNVVCVNGPHCH